MKPKLFDPDKEDPGALAAIHASAFAPGWDAAAIVGLLATPGAFAFHIQDGFVMVRAALWDGTGGEAEILTLAVRPAARRRGLGRALLEAAAAHAGRLGAENLFLEVGEDNPAALALYAGLGFRSVGRRTAYYGPGCGDAHVLKVQLPLPPPGKFA